MLMQKPILLLLFTAALLTGVIISACSAAEGGGTEEPGSPSAGVTEIAPTSPEVEPGRTTPIPGEEETPGQAGQEGLQDQSEADSPAPRWNRQSKQAVAAAIDREALIDWVFEGSAASAYHTVPPGHNLSTDPFFQAYGTRDTNLSISLLEGEGYSEENPLIIEFYAPQQPAGGLSVPVAIKEQLEDTGLILVNLHLLEWEDFLRRMDSGEMPLFLFHWSPEFSDPDSWLSPFASCALSPEIGIHYCSPAMDHMLHLASAAAADQRPRLYDEVGEMFASDPPVVPLYWEQETLVYRTGIIGTAFSPSSEFYYSALQFDEDALPVVGSPEAVVIGTTLTLENPTPHPSSNPLERDVFINTGLPLMRFSPGTNELVSGAAADYPFYNQEEMTYTFNLREDLVFSDGTPVTSEHYLLAWEWLITQEGSGKDSVTRYIDNVSAPDERTLVYHLSGANTFFPALAAEPFFLPLHPSGPKGDWIGIAESATGAYRLVSHSPGEETVLEVNPMYIGEDIPTVQTVFIRYYEDEAALGRAVEAGEVDIAWRRIGMEETTRLQNINGLTVDRFELPELHFLAFNHLYIQNR
jgi:peptide/nickel transport system substrate-binding protein